MSHHVVDFLSQGSVRSSEGRQIQPFEDALWRESFEPDAVRTGLLKGADEFGFNDGLQLIVLLLVFRREILELPKKFADYLDGKEPAKVYLRAADCGPRLWTVEVLFDGQGRMYLDKGWEKFAIAHGVDFGWFVHFKYEGDDVLTVKVFDGTMCRRYYYSDDEDTDDESDDVKPCIHPL
ncbi:hypothetical protein QYE76_012880 [Lolium multiflorum]|uniref:TF-B3 domain-containing protein n=1 Tax=Lolium multiflorum TaxID=4521 RepID=A0AAD8X419_LOLMU|nr:hypothetical protein QYE76_012880 [Lolium multiflorum]